MVEAEVVILWVHIAAGALAILGGLVAMVTEKGGLTHRRAGKGFVVSMAVVAATSIALYPLGPTTFRLFLAMVAVFSFYLVFSGYRVLSRKRPSDEASAVDWIAVALVILAGVGLLGLGGSWALDGRSFAPVLLVFGVIGTVLGLQDVRLFHSDGDGPRWILLHLQRMMAGYIAAVTAVSAVNFGSLPPYISWLWPTLIGTPLIVWWSRKYS